MGVFVFAVPVLLAVVLGYAIGYAMPCGMRRAPEPGLETAEQAAEKINTRR